MCGTLVFLGMETGTKKYLMNGDHLPSIVCRLDSVVILRPNITVLVDWALYIYISIYIYIYIYIYI